MNKFTSSAQAFVEIDVFEKRQGFEAAGFFVNGTAREDRRVAVDQADGFQLRVEPRQKTRPAAAAVEDDLKISADDLVVTHIFFDLARAALHGSRVGVEKPENLVCRVFCSFVKLFAAIGFAEFDNFERLFEIVSLDDRGRFVRASAVNDDDFVNVDETRNGVERFLNRRFFVESRDNDGKLHQVKSMNLKPKSKARSCKITAAAVSAEKLRVNRLKFCASMKVFAVLPVFIEVERYSAVFSDLFIDFPERFRELPERFIAFPK